MNPWLASVVNETQKIFFKKKTKVFLLITLLIPIVSAVFLTFFESRLGILPINRMEFPLSMLGVFTGVFLPLFVCMTTSDLFAGELGDRTLKISLLRPVSRLKVYFSKMISVGIYIVVHLALVSFISILSAFFIEGSQGVLPGLVKVFTAYSVSVTPLLVLAILVAFLSQFFKNSSGVITVSILIYIGTRVVSVVLPDLSGLLFTSYTDWYMLWIGNTISFTKIITVFMFMVSYSIIFLSSGYYLFDKKEL